MIRPQSQAKQELAHIMGRLHSCVRAALQEFFNVHGGLRFKYFGTTEPSVIHSLMKWHIEQAFPDGNTDGVKTMVTKKNLFVAIVGDAYQIKLKKLGRDFSTRNVMTQAVMDFLEQRETQLELLPAPTNLHLGYLPKNKAELLTSDIWLVCPDGQREPHWTLELQPAPVAAPTPIRVAPHQPPTRKSRVRAKTETKHPSQGDERADGRNK